MAAPATIAAPPRLKPIFSGRLFTNLYLKSDRVQQAVGSAWLTDDLDFNDQLSQKLTVEVHGVRVRVREASVAFSNPSWDVRVGRQIIPWGKTDGINPTDLLTAKDFTLFNQDEEVRRTGSNSIRAVLTPKEGISPFTFTAVYTPVAPRSKPLIPPGVLPAGAVIRQAPSFNRPFWGDAEAAIKIAYSGEGWDASAMTFRGKLHTPEYELALITPTSVELAPVFRAIQALGGDFSLSTSSYVFRGETAYVLTENNTGSIAGALPSYWQGVLGAERPWPLNSNFRVLTQVAWKYHPRYTPSSGPLATADALLLGYSKRFQSTVLFRVGYDNDDQPWAAEFALAVGLAERDSLFRPKLTYRWTDAIKTSLGMDRYAGPPLSPFGAAKTYNSVFFEAKLLF